MKLRKNAFGLAALAKVEVHVPSQGADLDAYARRSSPATQARATASARLEELRNRDDLRILVERKTRGSIGRTPDIRTACDSDLRALAFTVFEGRVELVGIFANGGEAMLTGPMSSAHTLDLACACDGGRITRRAVLSLYEDALKAIGHPHHGVSLHQVNKSK